MKKIVCILISIIFTVFLASCNAEDGIISDNKTNTATDNLNNGLNNNQGNVTTDNNNAGNVIGSDNTNYNNSRSSDNTLGGILTSDADMLISDTFRNSDTDINTNTNTANTTDR